MSKKAIKPGLWAQLLEVIGDGVQITNKLPNGLVTGNKYTVVKGNKILIEAMGMFAGNHKTMSMNDMNMKRINFLIKEFSRGGE